MAKAKEASHVAPENSPFQAAPEPAPANKIKETCANCSGAVVKSGLIFCHGQPPVAVYRGVVIGVGSTGDPVWPKMSADDWCRAWAPKEIH